MRRLVPAAIVVILCVACSSTPDPEALPFDVRPAMTGLRVDALVIARALEASDPTAAVASARRLESSPIAPSGVPLPPDFDTLAASFTSSARFVREALEREDMPRARIAFSQLLERCDACHDRFRGHAP